VTQSSVVIGPGNTPQSIVGPMSQLSNHRFFWAAVLRFLVTWGKLFARVSPRWLLNLLDGHQY